MRSNIKKILKVASAVLFCVCLANSVGYSQKAQPILPPPPDENVPVIISRADDYPDDNNQIITTQTENNGVKSLEDKIDEFTLRMRELSKRINLIESSKETAYDLKQKRLLLNLDILSKAESRAQNLRKQLIELVEKESDIKTRLDKIEYDMRPDVIDKMVAFAGTLRPEELREVRRKSLQSERDNLQNLLTQIQSNKTDLELNVQKADLLVDKLRNILEGEIDAALADEPKLK